MDLHCGYLILLLILPVLTAGKAVQQQRLDKWQLERLEMQKTLSSDKDSGPWLQISSAVLHVMPEEQTQILLLQLHEVASSTALPVHHKNEHEPRHGVSDNLDFQQPLMYIKSHGR